MLRNRTSAAAVALTFSLILLAGCTAHDSDSENLGYGVLGRECLDRGDQRLECLGFLAQDLDAWKRVSSGSVVTASVTVDGGQTMWLEYQDGLASWIEFEGQSTQRAGLVPPAGAVHAAHLSKGYLALEWFEGGHYFLGVRDLVGESWLWQRPGENFTIIDLEYPLLLLGTLDRDKPGFFVTNLQCPECSASAWGDELNVDDFGLSPGAELEYCDVSQTEVYCVVDGISRGSLPPYKAVLRAENRSSILVGQLYDVGLARTLLSTSHWQAVNDFEGSAEAFDIVGNNAVLALGRGDVSRMAATNEWLVVEYHWKERPEWRAIKVSKAGSGCVADLGDNLDAAAVRLVDVSATQIFASVQESPGADTALYALPLEHLEAHVCPHW